MIDAQRTDEADNKLKEFANSLREINSQSYKVIIELARRNQNIDLSYYFLYTMGKFDANKYKAKVAFV